MGEGLRTDPPLGFALYPIIADGVSRAQGFFQITCIQQILVRRVVRQHSGIEIGLQFKSHGSSIVLFLTYTTFP